MSKIALAPNISGTGTFTIASPGTATDRTLTLPDNSGVLLSNATTAGFPAGSVLQVVSATTNTYVQVAATSYTDTGLSASITPTSATSKILVLVNQAGYAGRDSSFGMTYYINLVRDSTQIIFNSYRFRAGLAGDGRLWSPLSSVFAYLDSPSTTSATTYKTRASCETTADSAALRFNLDGNFGSIVLLEIAA